MQKITLTIQNKLGLHARAAMKLIDTASRFQARATLIFNGKQADGKDILQVMCLGAKLGNQIDIEADGPDEALSLQAIARLIANKFGEAE